MYFYNGGGVAVGDLNGDSLLDIFFTSNQEPDKLYLNQGNFNFKDITEGAGVEGFNGWTTGVTMADVNNDGRLDIYVSYVGDYLMYHSRNQLFINEGNSESGIPQFKDRAMEYGLDLIGFSTQASFFDYDRDGDLDMFMLNHSLHQQGTFGKSTMRKEPHTLAGDKLLRNDNGHFVDVTEASGIYSSVLGYGLGVVVSDVNMDGWPDIYVGNDFHENDYLYINQGNGTFSEVVEKSMMHTSRYTMGVDFADFNNDAFPDLISMDMLPDDPHILKKSAAEDAFDVFTFKLNFGYNHQFARNVLQVNNQDGTFSDIALLAGVGSTDWSWSALFADFDLDGNKDIFVSNGIYRRSNDLDYINFIEVDSIQAKLNSEMSERELLYTDKMPKIKIPNFLFINNGDSTFTNRAADWGLEQPSYSNGTAYADLDNDGDLDIVINNIEDEAMIYENKTIAQENKKNSNHYLRISLKGKSGNLFGIGAKVFLYDSGSIQTQECMPTRGFQSSVDYRLTFGTGNKSSLDSVLIIWNDGTFQKLLKVNTDQHITFDQQLASGRFDYSAFHSKKTMLRKTNEVGIPFKHIENNFVEFNREPLIPHMVSAEGPAVAIADINGDNKDDVFLGGAKWKESKVFIQNQQGQLIFSPQPSIAQDSIAEDVDAAFFDADGDQDNDLFVVSGGNEFSGKSKHRKPRLYINDGRGKFSISSGIPEIYLSGSSLCVEDIDKDGDKDLFVGARATTWKYGIKPDSYILINDGRGNFEDRTEDVAPDLKKFGFVKNAQWADIDNDNDQDLLLAAEWSPITIFINQNGKLKPMTVEESGLQNSEGWWNFIKAVDIDKDGDLDMVAGNLGLNSRLKASIDKPVRMYVSDFDKNDSIDQVLTHYMHNKEYPFHTRDEMTKHMPYLKKRFLSYYKYAEATVDDIISEKELKAAQLYKVNTFSTSIIENLGKLKFKIKPLPLSAQISTAETLIVDDFNKDGNVDLLLGGNYYPVNIQRGRYDASYGSLLEGNGKGKFTAVPAAKSGFSVHGQVRHLRQIILNNHTYYMAVRNNDTVEFFEIQ
jgi:hypothetical protein